MKDDQNVYVDWMAKYGGFFKDMTLRDYFAAQALTGICANSGNTALKRAEQFAQAAYNVADAMLEARK